MDPSKRKPFESDSDDDSIATDSTAPSEAQDDYQVEKVLSEHVNEEGDPEYLIKWEGYPLHRSTWEPQTHLNSDVILEEWNQCKARIQKGLEQPFDLNTYMNAVQTDEALRDIRIARRKKKRRRKGIPVSSDDADEDVGSPPPGSPRKRIKQIPLKRKGVAQKLSQRRRNDMQSSSSDTSMSDDSEHASDADSLFDELGGKSPPPNGTVAPVQQVPLSRNSESRTSHARTQKETRGSGAPAIASRAARKPAQSTQPTSTLARKTAPSGGIASTSMPGVMKAAPVNIFGKTGNELKRRARPRVSGATPKDSAEPKFSKLREQRRYQLYSRNENAPDPNALSFINAKTGEINERVSSARKVPVEDGAQDTAEPVEISAAYARRGSMPSRQGRSPTPPTPRDRHRDSMQEALSSARRDAATPTSTCVQWRNGHCPLPAWKCPFAHWHMDRGDKSKACYFWRTKGQCNRSEAGCAFAHHHTGIDAEPPGSYSNRPNDSASDHSRSLTCYSWANGDCKELVDCAYAHYDTGKLGPQISTRQTLDTLSFSKRMTCFFWRTRGKCNKTDAGCNFSHHHTGIHAHPPAQYAAEPGASDNDHPSTLTCYRWKTGTCSKGTHCEFAHRDTGKLSAQCEASELANKSHAAVIDIDNLMALPTGYTAPPTGPRLPDQRSKITCRYWTQGICNKMPCPYAHVNPGDLGSTDLTAKSGHNVSTAEDNANLTPLGTKNRLTSAGEHYGAAGAGSVEALVMRSTPLMEGVISDAQVQSPQSIASPTAQSVQSPAEQAQPTGFSAWSSGGAAVAPSPSAISTSFIGATFNVGPEGDKDAILLSVQLETRDITGLQRLAGAKPVLDIKHMVMASDFEHFFKPGDAVTAASVYGGIAVDRSSATALENLTEACKARSAAFLALSRDHDSQMLIYPSTADEYRFMETGLGGLSPTATLHFRLFSKCLQSPQEHSKTDAAINADDLPSEVAIGEQLIGLDQKMLFNLSDEEYHKPHSERKLRYKAVFLMFSAGLDTEIAAYTRYFEGLTLRVYHSGVKGAWSYYRNKYHGSCLVLVHPEVPIWQIPGLHELTGTTANIISIGVNRTIAMVDDREPRFGCDRLFPLAHGAVIHITDDVFFYHPDKASEILGSLLAEQQNKHKLDRVKTRIVTRPDVKDWLFGIAIEKNERGRKDYRWMRLYNAFCKLLSFHESHDESKIAGNKSPATEEPSPVEDEHLPLSSAKEPLLIAPSEESMPAYSELWEKNETEATEYMVNWFAGWSVLNASRRRRFLICHEAKPESVVVDEKLQPMPDPRGWAKKYQHIGVYPPQGVLEVLTKKKK